MNDHSIYDTMSRSTANTSYSQETQASNPSVRFWSNNSGQATGSQLVSGPDFLGGSSAKEVLKPFPAGGPFQYNRTEPRASKGQLNVNAPSYIPAYAQDTSFADPQATQALEKECQELKADLILKNQIIKNLTEQLTIMDYARSKQIKDLTYPPITSVGQSVNIPPNHYQLFQDLSKTLQDKTLELEDTKERLDALVVSLTMGANGVAFTQAGHYDEQELANKIVSKLHLLKNENESLLQMFSYSNKSSLMVELGLLRNDNQALTERLRQQESQCQDTRYQE